MSVQLQIENTSVCQASCSFCPYPVVSKLRKLGNMSMVLFKKVLDEAASIDLISQVCITGLGEPLLDRFIVDRVRYAREKKPQATIDLFTNGVYLTPERFEALKGAGISSVQVSLNAVNGEQHEQVMGLVSKFDLVCANIDYAISHRNGVNVEVRAVISGDDFTRSDGYDFYDRWGERGKGGHGALICEGNWAEDNRTMRKFDPREACHRALSQVYIMWDGRVSTCCFDPTGKQVFGDLNVQTLREVYSSPDYVTFREVHNQNQADRYDICAKCTRI